jgi:hypothetical protein
MHDACQNVGRDKILEIRHLGSQNVEEVESARERVPALYTCNPVLESFTDSCSLWIGLGMISRCLRQ